MPKYYVDIIRNQKNMTVRELSDISGVAKSHIEKIEAGKTNPSVEVMCKLAEALQVPVHELFSCDHDDPDQ